MYLPWDRKNADLVKLYSPLINEGFSAVTSRDQAIYYSAKWHNITIQISAHSGVNFVYCLK